MTNSPQRETQLFDLAFAIPPAERRALLERECAGDTELRDRVLALLEAADASGGFLETPPTLLSGVWAAHGVSTDSVPARVGPYVIGRKLGEGGAGIVFEAEQTAPVRRHVALKLMKPGTDTEAAVARFEAERQVLAMMEHPNIARVFDAGATETGRLYFVMELVEGVRITEYCDRARLSLHARLRLFGEVCAAVQHAHQKGVIHRDLKPSNILVTTVDGAPVSKVIDFGIAKATRSATSPGATLTMIGHLLGTPAYMSPEQATGCGHDVDTRTDIYSLGVLLYELLTGVVPFGAGELARVGVRAMAAAIHERDPLRPSAWLSTTAQGELATIASQRQVEPATLIRGIRGDLDWVVLKAMERDRDRRYGTARELQADVQRHLQDEPVTARPPSFSYRAGKFVRRHRAGVGAAAGAALLLGATAIVSTALAVRAMRAEHRAERVMGVFHQILEGIGQTPALGPDSNLERSAREWHRVLDETAARATALPDEEPLVEARVRPIFGKIFLATRRFDEAERLFRTSLKLNEQTLGASSSPALDVRYDLGVLLLLAGRGDEGCALLAEVVEARRRVSGIDSPEAVLALEMLAFGRWVLGDSVGAEPLFREALAARERSGRLGVYDNQHYSIRNGLAMCLLHLGRNEEAVVLAEDELRDFARAGPVPRQFRSKANLVMAWALNTQGRHAEAVRYAREALVHSETELGPDHPHVAFSTFELASSLSWSDDPAELAEAERLYRRTIEMWRATRAAEDPNNLVTQLQGFAGFLDRSRRYAEAAPLFEEAWVVAAACEHPLCAEYQAEVIVRAIGAHTRWAGVDSSRAADVAMWKVRLARFEERARQLPPGALRTCAVRGLAHMLAQEAELDPSWPERAAFWREELSRCEQMGFPGDPGAGSSL